MFISQICPVRRFATRGFLFKLIDPWLVFYLDHQKMTKCCISASILFRPAVLWRTANTRDGAVVGNWELFPWCDRRTCSIRGSFGRILLLNRSFISPKSIKMMRKSMSVWQQGCWRMSVCSPHCGMRFQLGMKAHICCYRDRQWDSIAFTVTLHWRIQKAGMLFTCIWQITNTTNNFHLTGHEQLHYQDSFWN